MEISPLALIDRALGSVVVSEKPGPSLLVYWILYSFDLFAVHFELGVLSTLNLNYYENDIVLFSQDSLSWDREYPTQLVMPKSKFPGIRERSKQARGRLANINVATEQNILEVSLSTLASHSSARQFPGRFIRPFASRK